MPEVPPAPVLAEAAAGKAASKGSDTQGHTATTATKLEGDSAAHERPASSSSDSKAAPLPSDTSGKSLSLGGVEFAREAMRLGKPETAVRILGREIEAKSTDASLYLERSAALAAMGKHGGAMEDAHMASYLKPSEPRAFLQKGKAQVNLCDYDGAMATFQQGCVANPRDKELRGAWAEAKEMVRVFRRAGKMINGGEVARIQAFEAAREPCLHHIKKLLEPADKAAAFKNLAKTHVQWGRHREAIALIDMAIEYAPNDVSLLLSRAETNMALDEPRLALEDMQSVVEARPGWFDAINLLAKIHARLENWSAALPLWQECHRQQPHNPVIEMALQRANLEMQIDAAGMPSKVERVVRSGGGGGSDDADDPSAGLGNGDSPADDCPAQSASEAKARGLKDLAEDAFHRMDTRRALLLLGEAIGMAPHLADLWSLRSRVYEGIHRYKDALSDAQETICLAPEWSRGYLRAGRALNHLERYAEAISALQFGLEMEPNNKAMRDALEHSNWLIRAQQREQEALARAKPGGKDLLGIARGGCKKKECECVGYVQRHTSNAVLLQGRGYVRHDNNPDLLRCLRCSHEAYMHRDLRTFKPDSRPGPRGHRAAEAAAQEAYDAAQKAAEERSRVPHTTTGARGGLDGSYYYGAVGSADRKVPVEPPRKLSPEEAAAAAKRPPEGPPTSGHTIASVSGSASATIKPGEGYYYAHGRPSDYKVPVVPKRIGADGLLREWTPSPESAGLAPGTRHTPVRALIEELRSRGADVTALKKLARQVSLGLGDASSRETLVSMLKEAGYLKLGQRKALEAALLEDVGDEVEE